MKYIIRSTDGAEYGPVDQEVITQWVEDGRITCNTEIRNTLVKTWTTAAKVPFINDLIKERAAISSAEKAERDEEDAYSGPKEAVQSLNQAGRKKFLPGGPLQRLFAWLFDAVLTFGLALAVFFVIGAAWDNIGSPLNETLAFWAPVLFVFYFLMYYVLGLGFKAQTVGQWFWGLMIVRPDGGPVFAGRAFVYTLLYTFLFPSSFLFYAIMPGRRSLQELLSGTRIIKFTMRS